MSIAFQAASAAVSSGGASSATITWPGAPSNQLLIAVLGFEVGTGTGPWVTSTPQPGWQRCFYQDPSATGCGLEVWNVQQWTSGPSTTFNFGTSRAYVARGLVYTGQYTGAGNVVRASVNQSVTGNSPSAPTIYAYQNEMVVALGAEQLSSPGWDPPSGYTERIDSARGGSFGNVEITAADKLAALEGFTGALPFTATSAGGSDKGATGTIAIRESAAVIAATSPMIHVEYATPT